MASGGESPSSNQSPRDGRHGKETQESPANGGSRQRPHVRFTGGEALDSANQRAGFDLPDESDVQVNKPRSTSSRSPSPSPSRGRRSSQSPSRGQSTLDVLNAVAYSLSGYGGGESSNGKSGFGGRNGSSTRLHFPADIETEANAIMMTDRTTAGDVEQISAQQRAQRLARKLGTRSAPGSATTSPQLSPRGSNDSEDVPMIDLSRYKTKEPAPKLRQEDSAASGSTMQEPQPQPEKGGPTNKPPKTLLREAARLMRWFNGRVGDEAGYVPARSHTPGNVTPTDEREAEGYVEAPERYRGGVLSSLLKLAKDDHADQYTPNRWSLATSRRNSDRSVEASESSGAATPKRQKWYANKNAQQSTSSLAGLIAASSNMLSSPGGGLTSSKGERPGMHHGRTHSGSGISGALRGMARPRLEDEIRITIHIAETLARQRYLIKLNRCLMLYGAPTHRLEEYMKMSARVLEIDAQFMYQPGTMIISFGDSSTRTSEMTLLRVNQGIDLGKLKDVHEIYKEVVHDIIGVEEATKSLDEIITRPLKFNRWLRVFLYGCASALVGPFAFEARPIDMPIIFILGCVLGLLQLVVAPMSDLYQNVFEVTAAVVTSFLARAFGSIDNGNLFCFSALAQSSIALILPGYTVLTGSLELQSRNLVAGSVRLFYAIIYSLFLGFGITVGVAIYGKIDKNAVSSTTCSKPLDANYHFPFVIGFTICLIIINQGKWKQMPVMIVIAFAGYVVNFFTSEQFPASAQISQTLGAFAIGVLANLYSRIFRGLAAAALLPAIFVQVPSGIAATGSLITGLNTANNITLSKNATISDRDSLNGATDSILFNVGFSMIQVSIGITVGLFLSAIVVYPLGKRRSGLFSF